MSKRKILLVLVVCIVAVVLVGQSFSAAGVGRAGGGSRGGAGGRGAGRDGQGGQRPQGRQPGQMQRDPVQMREQMQKMMYDRIKQQLGISDNGWKTIQPKLQKVMDLNRQVNSSGRGGIYGGGFGGRGGFGGGRGGAGGGRGGPGQGTRPRQEGAPERPADTGRTLNPVEKAASSLQQLVDSKTAKPEQITKGLTSLRTAKNKARQDLAKAQADLKKTLTVKQEAQLVLMGLLN